MRVRKKLNKTFKDFLSYYGAVRHFGENKNEQNYRTVDQLAIRELDLFRRMTIEIWDTIITMYREDPQNDIDEFKSISDDAVRFKDLPEGVLVKM